MELVEFIKRMYGLNRITTGTAASWGLSKSLI